MSTWAIIEGASTIDLLTNLGFRVNQIIGAGMPPVDNIAKPFGLLDGSIFQRQRTTERQFTLIGTISGSSVVALHSNRSKLIDYIKPDRSASQQPVILQYSGASTTKQASAYYDSGMELSNTTARIESRVALRFVQFDPYWEGTTSCTASLNPQTIVASARLVIQRSACGEWAAMGTGVASGTGNNTVNSIITDSAGNYYIGGEFTTVNNASTTACRVAKWNGSTWLAVGNGMNAGVNRLAMDSTEQIIAVGFFTSVSALTACRVAKWTGTAWQAVGNGANGNSVNGITMVPDNTFYIGGDFTSVSALTACRVAKWTGTAWAAVGNAMNNEVYDVKYQNGIIYTGGLFTTASGTTACFVAQYNNGWTPIGGGIPNVTGVHRLLFDSAGNLYAGGQSVTSNCAVFLQWSGGGWNQLATTDQGNLVRDMTVDRVTGNIYVAGGTWSSVNGIPLKTSLFRFNGTTAVPPDINLGSGAVVYSVHSASDGTLTLGYALNSNASAAATVSVNNRGTANAYPILTACAPTSDTSGSATMVQLVNYTTGEGIYFNITLAKSEIVTLDLRPGKKTFTSNTRGNIISTILPGSKLATWKLVPGANTISFWLTGGSGAAGLTWQPRFWGIDG